MMKYKIKKFVLNSIKTLLFTLKKSWVIKIDDKKVKKLIIKKLKNWQLKKNKFLFFFFLLTSKKKFFYFNYFLFFYGILFNIYKYINF
jgi:hypothetical protein